MKRDPLRPVLAVVPLGPGRGRARAGYRQRAPEQSELPIDLRYRFCEHICRAVVYQGRITDQGIMAITVCRARNGHTAVTIYDRRGRSVTYRDLVRGTSVNIRFR